MTIISKPYDKDGQDTWDRLFGKDNKTLSEKCFKCKNSVGCTLALNFYSTKFKTCMEYKC